LAWTHSKAILESLIHRCCLRACNRDLVSDQSILPSWRRPSYSHVYILIRRGPKIKRSPRSLLKHPFHKMTEPERLTVVHFDQSTLLSLRTYVDWFVHRLLSTHQSSLNASMRSGIGLPTTIQAYTTTYLVGSDVAKHVRLSSVVCCGIQNLQSRRLTLRARLIELCVSMLLFTNTACLSKKTISRRIRPFLTKYAPISPMSR